MGSVLIKAGNSKLKRASEFSTICAYVLMPALEWMCVSLHFDWGASDFPMYLPF